MERLYTAVGRFERKNTDNGTYPVIIVNGKERMVGLTEMIIWACCCWRILNQTRLEELVGKKLREGGVENCEMTEIVNRLLTRGLIVSGIGDNEAEALYSLLSGLYIIPVVSGLLMKTLVFLKVVFARGIPFNRARAVFKREALSDRERRVVNLARQTTLSTAELIKCVELGVYDLSSNEKVMDALYDDDFTTCDNITEYAMFFKQRLPVLEVVANLYLRKLILFDVI